MIIGFVLVLSIIGVALSLSMYANLLPFIGTLGDIKQYNMAYYGAQSSLERSLLVLRYQEQGFDGEGGRIADTNIGPVSDGNPNFGQFMVSGNELYWQIVGRGSQVPLSGLGNIELGFLSDTSNDYNELNYRVFDSIYMGYDSTSDSLSYVRDNEYFSNTGTDVSTFFRLNPKIYSGFNLGGTSADLCSDNGCDVDGDGVDDDVAVDRGRKGLYIDGSISGSFSILPYQHVSYAGTVGTVQNDDQGLRESLITNTSNELLSFGNGANDFNPVVGKTDASSHLIVTDNDTLSGISFANMLSSSSPDFLLQQLTLSLINPLYSQQGSLYPFLEYRVVCNGCGTQDGEPQLSQPYFYITAQSKVGDYDVKMQLVKPSRDESLVSSFTVIF